MEQSPKISIIVPVYKVEPWLDRCVQSIVDQSHQNLEIILVDDGSPDHCGAMCDAWAEKDSRIQVIHKENGGLSSARNAGLAAATGEYIAFVDSDDWVHPAYLFAMYHAIACSGADVAACDVCFLQAEEAVPEARDLESFTVFSPKEAIATILRGRGFRAVAWNKLYRRQLLTGENFPVGKYHEDEFFTYRILAKAEKLAFVDAPLYYYFQRPGSIMRSVSIRHLDALDAYLQRIAFLESRYPDLYVLDKYNFCIACAGFYRDAMLSADKKTMQAKIKACRAQVRFSRGEFMDACARQKLYIAGTKIWIDLFCSVLNFRAKGA